MQNTVKQMIRSFTKQRTQRRRAYAAFTTLAILVSITTMYSLSQPASTMTGEPICGQQEHIHTDACYTEKLICGLEERTEAVEGAEEHVHDESCYEPHEVLVCTEEAAEAHSHDESCYGLVCGETEYPAHTHGDDCYAVVTETCGQEEHEAHSHDESCYTTTRSLTCGEAESAGHTHDDSCYDENGELTCGQSESAGHTHSDSCYTESTALTCGQTESAGHTHDDHCFVERVELTCTAQEGPGHVHDDSCYGLACGQEETEGHTHTEECYETRDELVCAAGHVHTADCYEKVLTCQLPEHVHSSACYDQTQPEAPDEPEYICGLPAHAHDDACLDEEGNLICGLEEHEHTEDCLAPLPQEKVYTAGGEEQGFTVTVTAPVDAVPQGAELKADLLDKNSEAYKEAAKALDHKEVKRSDFIALDVRFELDGEEVEPTGTVQVEIDASGLIPAAADPDSVAVQHHKEEKTKLLGLIETGTETVVETVADVTGETGDVTLEDEALTAQFPVDSFSVFTITWGESQTLNVHYVTDEGMEIPGSQIREVYVPVGQWVALEDYASNGAGIDDAFTYNGAKLNSDGDDGIAAAAVKFDGENWYYTANDVVTDETVGTELESLNDIYLVYTYTRQDTEKSGYDETLANRVLSNTHKANTWQVVSGEYREDFGYTYEPGKTAEDSNVRMRKEVMSTDVENEFYIYLEVGARTSWKDLFLSSSSMVISHKQGYKPGVYTGDMVTGATGNPDYLYLPDDPNRPANANVEYILNVQFYRTVDDYQNKIMYDEYTKICYSVKSVEVPQASFLIYVPSANKTVVVNSLDLKTETIDGIHHKDTIIVPVIDTELELDGIVSDITVEFSDVTDVMGISGGDASYINYEGLVTADGEFVKASDGTYQWILPESAEIEKPDGSTEGNYWTTYRLLYKISLDVEAEGFNSCAPNQTDPYGDQYQTINPTDSIYETNGLTQLSYKTTSTTGGGTTTTTDDTLNATSPQVQGLLYNYYLYKVEKDSEPVKYLSGVEFTMTDQFGKAHTAVSDKNGLVSFVGLPWGDYTLTETQAPEGYVELTNPVAENINLCYTHNAGNLVQDTENTDTKPLEATMMKLKDEPQQVENQLANGDLTLTKILSRTDKESLNGDFKFLLKIPVEKADTYSCTSVFDETTGKPVYGTDTLTFTAETGEDGKPTGYAVAEVILKHEEKIAVSLPIGTTVLIEEQGAEGYSVRWTVDGVAKTPSKSIEVGPIDADGVDVICTNTTGAELPQTGGMGTRTFTFLGMMMMLSAGVLLMIQRRRREGI